MKEWIKYLKKNYESQWTNPITNETSTIEVTGAVTEQQQRDLE